MRPAGAAVKLDVTATAARKVRCTGCGAVYVAPRPSGAGVCLTCEIRTRSAAGESAPALAARFDLPPFLIRAVAEGAE